MTQQSPYTILSDQASVAIDEINEAYKNGVIKDIDHVVEKLREQNLKFIESAGRPIASYEPIRMGEPPVSSKMNRFLGDVRSDVAVLKRQNETLRASAVASFNVMATEIMNSVRKQNLLKSRLKTLELYSSAANPTVISYTERFYSDDTLRPGMVEGSVAAILGDSYLTLAREGEVKDLTSRANVSIEDSSNGFVGNFLELLPDTEPVVDPVTNVQWPTFLAEVALVSDLNMIVDGNPSTWFEFSAFRISDESRESAPVKKFTYYDPVAGGEVDWSYGPINPNYVEGSPDPKNLDVLDLHLVIDLGAEMVVNQIVVTPHGLRDNANHPYRIHSISTTIDGDNWTNIDMDDVWVGTNVMPRSLAGVSDYFVDEAVITFPPRMSTGIKVSIQQDKHLPVQVGNMYYVNPEKEEEVEAMPTPSLLRPYDQYNPSLYSSRSGLRQVRDSLDADRWSIGIKDITVSQVSYAQSSTMISSPIMFPGIVDRVALDADVYIPEEFPGDRLWVEFFISGDRGLTWTQVSRITDNYLELPEVLVFNDNSPEGFRETGAVYLSTENVVNSIMVKTVLSRPGAMTWATPMVRSYTVKAKVR